MSRLGLGPPRMRRSAVMCLASVSSCPRGWPRIGAHCTVCGPPLTRRPARVPCPRATGRRPRKAMIWAAASPRAPRFLPVVRAPCPVVPQFTTSSIRHWPSLPTWGADSKPLPAYLNPRSLGLGRRGGKRPMFDDVVICLGTAQARAGNHCPSAPIIADQP